jgi:hypothetical protein
MVYRIPTAPEIPTAKDKNETPPGLDTDIKFFTFLNSFDIPNILHMRSMSKSHIEYYYFGARDGKLARLCRI